MNTECETCQYLKRDYDTEGRKLNHCEPPTQTKCPIEIEKKRLNNFVNAESDRLHGGYRIQ